MWSVVLVGCGGSNKPVHPPSNQVAQAAVDEAVQMFVDVGSVVIAAQRDCDVMASKVGAWLDRNARRRKRINSVLARIQAEPMKRRYRDGLNARLDVVMGMKVGLEDCQAHAGFRAVWRRLER